MKRNILAILLVLTTILGYSQTQNAERTEVMPRDSIVMKNTLYYSKNQGGWIEPAYYKAIGNFLKWAKTDTETPIMIVGWADSSGNESANQALSLRRAKTVRNYLVGKGINAQRITFEGRGVDNQAENAEKARRADIYGVIRLVEELKPEQPTKTETPKPIEDNELEPAKEQQITEQPSAKQSIIEQTTVDPAPTKIKSTSRSRWYAGIELGVPIGISTFTSFEPKGGASFEGGIFGGYRFSPLLSIEFGATFGTMKLGASRCCFDYYLGTDGIRYLTYTTGMESYSYKDVCSSVFVQQYALRLNVDMLQICNPNWNKRWSLTISPVIDGISTKATLKTDNTTIFKRNSRFQFGAGGGIGGGYQITENLGIGLRTGMVWVFGERFDGIVPTDNKENMIWNNTMTLNWRFGRNK